MRLSYARIWPGRYDCRQNELLRIVQLFEPGKPKRFWWVAIAEGCHYGPFSKLDAAKAFLQHREDRCEAYMNRGRDD